MIIGNDREWESRRPAAFDVSENDKCLGADDCLMIALLEMER
jgi:hypothetical protein